MALLLLQIVLSFVLVWAIEAQGWPRAYQAVGPALALAATLTMGSVIKAVWLSRLLGASVASIRPGLIAAIVAGLGTGVAISNLPEWTQLTFGIPLILAAYFLVLFKLAFGREDKALFRRMPREQDPVLNEVA
jgi:hypothetical protein